MKISDFKPFVGQHCETTATGCLLKQLGIELSEPMFFGLGEGLGYIYWNMKTMDFPFIGGRVKPEILTQNICRNLKLDLDVKETASSKKAWANVAGPIESGKAVGLKLDCYHLEYFSSKIHFAGHYVAMYGFDDQYAYLIDTKQQGGKVKTSLKNLELARSEKGPMSSKSLSYCIDLNGKLPDLKKVIPQAIRNNATEYLNPAITNMCFKGILKTSKEIKKFFNTSKDVKEDFQTIAMLMERAGTGGSLFRNFYRDFLKESFKLLATPELETGYKDFVKIAKLWKQVSELFHEAGQSADVQFINEASELLVELSRLERAAMEKLSLIGK